MKKIVKDCKSIVLAALEDAKAKEIQCFDVRNKTVITDVMIVASGSSSRHLQTLAETVISRARDAGLDVLGVEGKNGSNWVLVDLADVLVHMMLPATRDFYNLEKLWGEESPDSIAMS